MKKPLVIAHSYLLEKYSTGQVVRCFFEELQKKGFNSTIVCSKSKHNDVPLTSLSCRVFPCKDNQLIRYLIAAAKRIVAPDFAFLPDYSYFSWAKVSAIKETVHLAKEEHFDYIHSISIPCSSHLIALEAKKQTGLPWIAQFYDPWYENPYRKITIPRFKERDRRYEAEIAEKADAIIHTNHIIYEEWVERYGESIKEKMHIMPLVFREPILTEEERTILLKPISEKTHFTISHIGSLYPGRDSECFLKAVDLFLKKYPKEMYRIKINYVGAVTENDRRLVSQYGLGQIVKFVGFIGENECKQYFIDSDIFLAVDGENARDIFFPSKIMKYLYYGKPILGITPESSVLDYELSKSGNYSFRHKDIEGIAEFIRKCLINFEEVNINNRDYWQGYTVHNITSQYVDIINQIMKKC